MNGHRNIFTVCDAWSVRRQTYGYLFSHRGLKVCCRQNLLIFEVLNAQKPTRSPRTPPYVLLFQLLRL